MAGKKRGRKSTPSVASIVAGGAPARGDGRDGRDDDDDDGAPPAAVRGGTTPAGRSLRNRKKKRRKEDEGEEEGGRGHRGGEGGDERENDAPDRHATIVRHISTFLSSAKTTTSNRSMSAKADADADADDDAADDVDDDEDDDADDEVERTASLDSSVSHLIDFLEPVPSAGGPSSEPSTPAEDLPAGDEDSALVTERDVAELLLPWSVGRLVRSSSAAGGGGGGVVGAVADPLAWRALSRCLGVVVGSVVAARSRTAVLPEEEGTAATTMVIGGAIVDTASSSAEEELLSACLSQSALNRLVPYAARVSFAVVGGTPPGEEGQVATSTVTIVPQKHASRCFLHLARRFRPPLDGACALLREVDALVTTTISVGSDGDGDRDRRSIVLPDHQADVVTATLAMMHSLMPNANPKKLFATACSTEVLPLFGRLMKVRGSGGPSSHGVVDWDGSAGGERGTADAATPDHPASEDLVKNILWEGLFHPVHHVDGFRTMWELHAANMPSPRDGVVAKDANATAAENPPTGELSATKAKGSKGGGKYCFQSSLFKSMQSLTSASLGNDVNDGGEEKEGGSKDSTNVVNDAIATANIMPIIIHGFFTRIRDEAQRRIKASGGGSGSTSEADAGLQFRFWCRVIFPVLEQLGHPSSDQEKSGELKLALLEATSETLGLVLKFDAYSPSYEDPDGRHFAFLDRVATGLLLCIGGGNMRDDDGHTLAVLLASLCRILMLNHRLLHERLAGVVSFACSCLHSPSDRSNREDWTLRGAAARQASDLLSKMVRTYRELRQVGHFLSSARGAFAQASNDPLCMKNLLLFGNVMDSLSMAYQTCPSGQLREIWEFFEEWIAVKLDRKNTEDPPRSLEHTEEGSCTAVATDELSFAVQMFAVFIKSVRADKQNSPELRRLCEMSARTSVAKLLSLGSCGRQAADVLRDSAGDSSVIVRRGFDLCGWLVDLHSRSCFWIDALDVNGQESFFLLAQNDDADEVNVLAYLHNVAKTTVSTEQFKAWRLQNNWQASTNGNSLENFRDIGVPQPLLSSLQRLALHRIHQLHSMIYYSNLRESERHASDLQDDHSSSRALIEEARMLVDFSLYIACSQETTQSCPSDVTNDVSSESLWSPVAQSLCIWAHYSDPFHAALFLIWFFTTLCQEHSETLSAQVFRLEKTVALTIARDASFYDVGEVMSLITEAGMHFAFSMFLQSIEITLDSIEMTGDPLKAIAEESIEDSGGLAVSCMELTKLGDAKLTADNHVDAVNTALSFLTSMPLELALCNENLNLLDRVIGLDILASHVIKQAPHAQDEPQLLNIVRLTKIAIANILPKTLLLPSNLDVPFLNILTVQLSKNFLCLSSDEGVRSASSDAISEYFSMCIDYNEHEANMLEKFFSQMRSLVSSAADGNGDFISEVILIRSVIRKMNILVRRHSLSSKNTPSNTSLYESCTKFVQYVYMSLQNTLFQHVADAGSGSEYQKASSVALLLESEILSFFGNHAETTQVPSLITNEQVEDSRRSVKKVFELIDGMQGTKRDIEFVISSSYFLSSMAAVPGYFLECVAPSLVLKSILQALAISHEEGRESPLLGAALCSLIRNADLEQTKTVTNHMLEDDAKHDSAFTIKIFHMLMTCANGREQHKYIAGKCNTFLFLSLGLLRGRPCERAQLISNVELYSKTMTVLISKKELLLLGGREIAIVLCEMNPLLYRDVVGENDSAGNVAIFKSCCSVVESLIAHYPKQLYGCPSPLFSLLLALLSHILQTSVKKDLSLKALEYAKVCELLLPHKDIFKKHVVGLVLCYIQALNKGMNPTAKSKLMPSIYALLDMCSEFETRQINAMIDVPSKTLFAPVFQSYRKYYQYHGQA